MILVDAALWYEGFLLLLIAIVLLIRKVIVKDNSRVAFHSSIICIVLLAVCLIFNNGMAIDLSLGTAIFYWPICILAFYLYVLNIGLNDDPNRAKSRIGWTHILKCLVITIVPVCLIAIPFGYEMYELNTCDCVLMYNYQNGIVINEWTCIAVSDTHATELSIKPSLTSRSHTEVDSTQYWTQDEDGESFVATFDGDRINDVLTSNVETVANMCPEAEQVCVETVNDGEYSVISAETANNQIIEDYLFHENDYIQTVSTHGDLRKAYIFQ